MTPEHMEHKSRMLVAIQLIRKQAEDIKVLAKEQYTKDLGGATYKQHGVSQFHALGDIAREAAVIDFACNAMTAQLDLLEKLYANQPIIKSEDATEAERIVAEAEKESASPDTSADIEELF